MTDEFVHIAAAPILPNQEEIKQEVIVEDVKAEEEEEEEEEKQDFVEEQKFYVRDDQVYRRY